MIDKEIRVSLATTPEQVEKAITRGFELVEREFTAVIRQAFDAGFGDVAKIGTCASLVLLKDSNIYTANGNVKFHGTLKY